MFALSVGMRLVSCTAFPVESIVLPSASRMSGAGLAWSASFPGVVSWIRPDLIRLAPALVRVEPENCKQNNYICNISNISNDSAD